MKPDYMSQGDYEAEQHILAKNKYGEPEATYLADESEIYKRGAKLGYAARDNDFYCPDPPAGSWDTLDFCSGWITGQILALSEEYDRDFDDLNEDYALIFTNNKYDLSDMLDHFRAPDDPRRRMQSTEIARPAMPPYRILIGFSGDPAENGFELYELGYPNKFGYPLPIPTEDEEGNEVMISFADEDGLRQWAEGEFSSYRIVNVYPKERA